MTLQELLAIPESEFLTHPEVRRIYWLALGQHWKSPPLIPGSLADAAEALRGKAHDKLINGGIDGLIYRALSDYHIFGSEGPRRYIADAPVMRFCVFAAALGALEGPK